MSRPPIYPINGKTGPLAFLDDLGLERFRVGLTLAHGDPDGKGNCVRLKLRGHNRPYRWDSVGVFTGWLRTTAEMWLPVADGYQLRATSETSSPEGAPNHEATVLLVEDDALVLVSTAAMLDDLGYVVLTAGSAEQALVLLEQQQVHILLVNQVLPGKKGSDLAQSAISHQPDLRVFLMTAYGNESLASITSLPVLNKPFDQATLAQALAQALADNRALSRPC